MTTIQQVVNMHGKPEQVEQYLTELLDIFLKKLLTLLADAAVDISGSGTLRLHLLAGVHYKSEKVLQAINAKDRRRMPDKRSF